MYTARDVMTTNVIGCPAHATVEEAIHLLLGKQISGAPVISPDGRLVGIISEYPLLEVVFNPELRTASVQDFMTRDVLTVTENTLLSDVAGMFLEHKVRRLPVLRDEQVVGLISRPDLLRYALDAGEEVTKLLRELNSFTQ